MKYIIQIVTLALISFLTLEQVKAQNISSINAEGKWIVNGEYFLPVGFYTEALSFDDYPNLAQQVAAGGFNYLYAESYPVDSSEVTDYMNKFGDFLDDCDSLNIEVVCGTLWQSVFPERFDDYVNFLKAYPALIAWNLMDDANAHPLADVINQRHHLDSLDALAARIRSISYYGFTPNYTYMSPYADVAYMQSYPWG